MECGLWHNAVEVAALGHRTSVSGSVVAQNRRVCSLGALGPPVGRKSRLVARFALYRRSISERKKDGEWLTDGWD